MKYRYTHDSFDRGFDEETGRTINATSCPACSGPVRTDGGQIDCCSCGLGLNEYARTGRLPDGETDRPQRGSREELA